MTTELVFVILFSVAAAVALVARRFNVPYTVALVIAGLALGLLGLHPPALTKELLYAIFLPGLIFEAAFHLEAGKLWESRLTVQILAVPGVAVATGLTALFLLPSFRWLDIARDFGLPAALVFGALLSATDPIAVVALFKNLGAPKRLAVIVEGESLINDATAAVALTVILSVIVGTGSSIPAAAFDFFRILGIGIAVGAAVGFLISRILRRIDDPMIEITATTIAAYGSFATAEALHASGVISTVVAGMICGNYGVRVGMSETSRNAVAAFWEYLAFALNSIVFLLIGFQVHISALVASWRVIVPAFLAITLARAIVVALVSLLLRASKERFAWSWSLVLLWGGLRGSLSMVLALALPASFPERELLITMTYGVVILSILLQGLSMPTLLAKLKLSE